MIRLVCIALFLGFVVSSQDLKRRENEETRSLGICKGQKTPLNKFPYMASLSVMKKYFGIGIVVNKRWILTSAFNVRWWQPEDLEVRVGSVQYEAKGQVFSVEKIVCHEQYNGGWDNNIALLKMKNATKRKGVKIGKEELPAGTIIKTAGWGSTEPDSFEPSPILLSKELNVMDWNKCNETYSPDLTSTMICTSNEDSGPCLGDIGAPMIYEDSLYGIYSGAKNYTNIPRLYTNVAAHSEWIYSTINE